MSIDHSENSKDKPVQEVHGPQRSPEEQFLTIHKLNQSHVYTSTLDEKKREESNMSL